MAGRRIFSDPNFGPEKDNGGFTKMANQNIRAGGFSRMAFNTDRPAGWPARLPARRRLPAPGRRLLAGCWLAGFEKSLKIFENLGFFKTI